MTVYFYDEIAEKLIALDTETKAARELSAVSLGAEVPSFTNADVFPTRANKSARKCSVCEEPGHTAKTCPKNKPSSFGLVAKKKRSGAGCAECGSRSWHRKGCSRAGSSKKPIQKMEGNDAWKELGEVSTARPKALSRMTFGRVKISQEHDIPTQTVARNLDEPVSEIEKAFDADTYDAYLKL